MKDEPTLEQVEQALSELELLMSMLPSAGGSDQQMEIFAGLYAKAYTMKLRLMPKESKHENS